MRACWRRRLLAWLWLGARAAASERTSYALIIDAGSSGSRLRVYARTGEKLDEVQPSKEDAELFETEPGLSAYADDPSLAGPSLSGLLDMAKKYIPEASHSQSRLWVKATAGMRIVPPAVLKRVFTAVDGYLSDRSVNPFKFVASEVLGGEEEAVFAYLSLNHLLGSTGCEFEDCVGALDMGGASMQIAYKPKGDILAHEFNYYVHQKRQSVYAKSYIRFGIEESLRRLLKQLLRQAGTAEVEFPCFSPGYHEVIEIDGVQANFTGTGDSARCEQLAHGLLHADYECMLEPCPMMGVHMSPLSGLKFYAISGYFYVVAGLGLVGWDEVGAVSPRQIHNASQQLCGRTKQEALAHSGAPWKYLKSFCFAGHYVRHILKALGFEDDSLSVTYIRQLPSGASADWTLGAVLFETQYMPMVLSSRGGPCPERAGTCPAEAASGKWQLPTLTRSWLPASSASAGPGPVAWLVGPLFGAAALAVPCGAFLSRRLTTRPHWQAVPVQCDLEPEPGSALPCGTARRTLALLYARQAGSASLT